jgi:transmembrane sensor
MDQRQARELLKKYQSGRCTQEEKALVEEWYRQRFASSSLPELHTDPGQQKVRSLQNILAETGTKKIFEARLRPVRYVYLAAVAAAVLLIGFFWFSNQKVLENNLMQVETVSLTTSPGQVTRYVLPDSSQVTLNGGSHIEYSRDFGGGQRAVTIREGEAFFDVRHDPDKPFVVEAAGTRTQVLGTAFSIRAYERLNNVSITVARGKVSVESGLGGSALQKEFLLPNDQLAVNKRDGQYQRSRVDAPAVMSWIKGILDFNNEDLATIALLLEKKFNVSVSIDDDDLREQRLTGKFRPDETIDDILGTLGIAGNFRFSHQANSVLISLK